MAMRLREAADRWCDLVGVGAGDRPSTAMLDRLGPEACRPGADPAAIGSWERRHGYRLPGGLRAWLGLSDGLFAGEGPLVHPLAAIGPMVPFARVPGLVVEPESWFELGNPNVETVCLELGYRGAGGGSPVFTSGDDERGTAPRLIAAGFDAWFLKSLVEGGREYWFDPGFTDLGDPWQAHRRNVPPPCLPDSLRRVADRVGPLVLGGDDDRVVAARFGISRSDVEAIARHVQHAGPALAARRSPL